MLLALFADIHANRQAFTACLAKAREQGAETIVLLGDYVGYGADPDWTVSDASSISSTRARSPCSAITTSAIGNPKVQMNAEAEAAIEWTRGQLDVAQRQFLAGLPMKHEEANLLFVHSEATRPEGWIYVTDTSVASRSMQSVAAHVTFCGHVHKPALYSLSVTGKMTTFVPTSVVPVHLLPGRQWLAVLGSVGQPRDGNPAAAYALYDTDKRELTYCRVPYDVEGAAAPDSRERPADLARRPAAGGAVTAMDKPSLEPGTTVDGLHHRGAVASRRHGDAVRGPPRRRSDADGDEDAADRRGRGSGRDRQLRDGADADAAAVRAACAALRRARRIFRRSPTS